MCGRGESRSRRWSSATGMQTQILTGEIKALQYGELIFKSSYMKDDVHLDWKEVKTIESQGAFIVGLSDGKRTTGFISKKRQRWQ